jgi:formate C-acetyltransferase
LKYDEVCKNFEYVMNELARVYAKSMYVIHYMHDKYYYEKAQMAFID